MSTEKFRTGPAIDAPGGYAYTPAPPEVHRIMLRRFEYGGPTALHPTMPGWLLFDVGNFWDGPREVRDNGDGSYSYTNPFNGEVDRFDAAGSWWSDGVHRPWSE